jgi:hypothetical protein
MTEHPNITAPDDTSPEALEVLMGQLVDKWADDMQPMERLTAQRHLTAQLDAFKGQILPGVGEPFTSSLVHCLERAAWRKYDQTHRPVMAA